MTAFTREDYEMAAKAAGMYGVKHVVPAMRADQMGPDDTPTYHLEGYAPDGRYIFRWNPPEDDGDALRLMVKLRLCVEVVSGCTTIGNVVWIEDEDEGEVDGVIHGDDPCAATRHAIFRAAIAVGRAMP